MSRRDGATGSKRDGGEAESRRPPPRTRPTVARDLLLMLGSFVLASALAGALGATNLGTALAFGQIAFAITLVYVLLRR
jgi:hypothetical protein